MKEGKSKDDWRRGKRGSERVGRVVRWNGGRVVPAGRPSKDVRGPPKRLGSA